MDLECRASLHLEPICNFPFDCNHENTRHGQENLSNTLSKVSHIRWAHFDPLSILAISAEGTLARGEDQTDGGRGVESIGVLYAHAMRSTSFSNGSGRSRVCANKSPSKARLPPPVLSHLQSLLVTEYYAHHRCSPQLPAPPSAFWRASSFCAVDSRPPGRATILKDELQY